MAGKPTYEELKKKLQDLEGEVVSLRETEKRLRESQEELADIFVLSLDMLCVADINTMTFLKVNPAFSNILGFPENELLNHSFLDFVHPDDVEPTIAVVKERLKMGEKVVDFVNRYRCADGTYRWLNWLSHPIPERGVTFAVAHDITESKRAQEALRESEIFVRAVMDNLPIGIAVNSVDPAVTFEYMNDNFPRFYRATREALAHPDAFWDAVYEDPQFRAVMRKRILDDCATGDPARMFWEDVPITRKGQETTFITARNTPLPEKGLMISTVWDVTERKKAEAALQETKRLLEEAQAITRLGGWEYDVASERLTWTGEVYRIHGLEPDEGEIDVDSAMRHYKPASRPLIKQAFRRAIEQGEPYDLELELIRADGTPIWIRTMGQPIIKDGRVVRVTGNIIDITERKHAEEEREKLQAQLLQAQKMESVGRLAGGVAHDFNNMLGVILGHALIALEQIDPADPVYASIEEIQKAAQRSADLTRQLLAFARQQTIAPKILELNTTVDSMLKMLRRLIGEDIDLVWVPGSELWPVKMDPSQIDQILANLCVNARDAIAGAGKIIIETGNAVFDEEYCTDHPEAVPGEYVLIAVSDNGRGMEREVTKHLFEPFFTTKGIGHGTGLGLATVYGIVKQNQGFINVYSEPGKGTTFRVYLPRYLGGQTEARMDEKNPVSPDKGGGETILLVEDEPAILKMCMIILQKLGYNVLTAATPGEAINLAENFSGEIHMLITDVIMPEMNGRDLAKQLLTLHPSLKPLFMSGYTANVIAHSGVLDEGVYFIQKPFAPKELAAKVRTVLEAP